MVRSNSLRKAMVIIGLVTNLARVAIIPGDTAIGSINTIDNVSQPSRYEATEATAMTESLAQPESTVEATRFQEISGILQTISTGRAALQALADYNVPVSLQDGTGSYYDSDLNLIVLDSQHSDLSAALVLVHEATHAWYRNHSLTPDPSSLTREEYVARRISQEADGQARAIEAKLELGRAGFDISHGHLWFEKQYAGSYKWAAMNPEIAGSKLRTAAREEGRRRLAEGLADGWVKTSVNGLTYADHYGGYWDEFAAYMATQAGSSDKATAAAPKSTALELDADTTTEANNVPTRQVELGPRAS